MSTDRSVSVVRALGVPDPRLADSTSKWTAEMSWLEQSPRAGRPVDQGDSDLVLAAYGAREDDDTIEIRAVKGGGIDPVAGAGFAFREDGDALWRGQQPPTSIWGWDSIYYTDGSGSGSTVVSTESPHAVTSSTGTVIVAYQGTTATGAAGVYVATFTEGGSWSIVQVFGSGGAAPSNDYHPCMYIVPRASGDRVHLLYWVENTTTQTLQVAMRYSDDDGATWTLGSVACLQTPLYDGEVEGKRLRAAYRNGQVVLFAQTVGQTASDAEISNDFIQQWASFDNGATFEHIASGQGDEDTEGAFPDVVATPSGFVLANVGAKTGATAGEHYTMVRRLPDAFTPFTGLPRLVNTTEIATQVGGTAAGYLQVATGDLGAGEVRHVPASATVASSKFTYNRGDLSLIRAENGTLYMVTSAVSTYNTIGNSATATNAEDEVVVTRSVDDGQNWEPMGNSDMFELSVDAAGRPRANHPGSATLFRTQDTSSYLRHYAGTWWRGRLLVAHQWAANPGNEDNSMCVLAAGGYSTVNLPKIEIARDETTAASWLLTWVPMEVPGDLTSWVAAGTGTESLTGGKLRVTTSSDTRTYSNGDATDDAAGYIVRAALAVDTAPVIAGTRVGFSCRAVGASSDYHIEVRFSDSAIRLYDMHAGAAVGTDATVDTTGGVEVICSVQNGTASVWYKIRSLTDDSEYIAGPTGSLTDAGSVGGSDGISWGVLGNNTSTVDWYEFHFVRSNFTGDDVEYMADMSNPADLYPIPYSVTGTYVTDGVSVRATRGPALQNDEHHIGVASDYPVSRVFPAVFPSPRRGTRTVDDSAASIIAQAYDPTLLGTVESAPLSDTMCLAVLGANWKTGYVERYDVGSATWVTLATINTATGLTWGSGGWTRYGSSIRAEGTGIGPYTGAYLEPNELAGATIEFSGGDLRRASRNTEGTTDGQLDGRKAVVTFDGGDNTESTTSVSFWMPNFVVWWNMLGETAAGLRLRIPAQSTVDGDLRVGTLVWCNVHPFGMPYSYGRALGQEHGVQVVEAEDRTYRTRTLAPSRRSVTISWEDGVPTCNVSGSSPDPDYLYMSTSPGALPVASAFDVPMLLRGLSEQVNGPSLPVVYLPSLAKGPPDETTLNRRKDFLVGVIDGDVQLDTVRGDENSTELIRVSSQRILEVV